MLLKMFQKRFVPLAIALIAILSLWLFREQPDKVPPSVGHNAKVADSYMENFTATILDQQGRPRYELSAATMAHYSYDDHSEFDAPRLVAYRPHDQRWTVVAESGTALQGTREIVLHGAVTVQRHHDAEPEANLEIRTRELRVRPDDNMAETDQHAVIVRGTATLQSDGLQANFRDDELQLLSQVRGRYAP
jgi:lipopolysaccharide export system protein LptC